MKIDPSRQALGNCLKLILLRHELSQSRVARYCEWSRQYVGLLCTGATAMSVANFQKIRVFLSECRVPPPDLAEFNRLFIETKIGVVDTCSEYEKQQLTLELKSYMEQARILNACLELAVSEPDLPRAVRRMAKTVTLHSDAQGCAYFRFVQGRDSIEKVVSWDQEELAEWLRGRELSRRYFRQWLPFLLEHRVVNWYLPGRDDASPGDDPGGKQPGSRAILAAGIWLNNELHGFIVLVSLNRLRPFAEPEERLLQSSARIIQLVMEGRRLQERNMRDEYERRLTLAYEESPMLFFDAEGNFSGGNLVVREMLNVEGAARLVITSADPVRRALASRRPEQGEIFMEGGGFPVTAVPTLDRNGALCGVVCFCHSMEMQLPSLELL